LYKPYTVEQYKVYQFIKNHFVTEHFLISPLSRSALMLEDQAGDKIAFLYQDNTVREISIPPTPDPEKVRLFIDEFASNPLRATLNTFDSITRWWLAHPNPLNYQQALSLPDDLYHHFLTYSLITVEEVRSIIANGLVSEKNYNDIRLWYRNGNYTSCWLGPLGVDGTGHLYGLIFQYNKPEAEKRVFYLVDEYYRYMNHNPSHITMETKGRN